IFAGDYRIQDGAVSFSAFANALALQPCYRLAMRAGNEALLFVTDARGSLFRLHRAADTTFVASLLAVNVIAFAPHPNYQKILFVGRKPNHSQWQLFSADTGIDSLQARELPLHGIPKQAFFGHSYADPIFGTLATTQNGDDWWLMNMHGDEWL